MPHFDSNFPFSLSPELLAYFSSHPKSLFAVGFFTEVETGLQEKTPLCSQTWALRDGGE